MDAEASEVSWLVHFRYFNTWVFEVSEVYEMSEVCLTKSDRAFQSYSEHSRVIQSELSRT